MSVDQGRESKPDALPLPNTDDSQNRPPSGDDKDHTPLPPFPTRESSTILLNAEQKERLDQVLQSDIGISTLLNRLKQSVSSARDFAAFLKERSMIEEKHAQTLKRLSRSTHDSIRRPESRGGSYATNLEEITKIHDRVADNGTHFASSLHQMYEELQELTARCERDRKHWKQTGLEAEKRVADAEAAMNKAKGKYNSLAEQYDRARTGERTSGKFGIKKSGAQAEEDLHRKLESADGEYASKVQSAQSSRQDLVTTHRPQAVKALQGTIQECDVGLSMQMAKYAAMTERMLLSNAMAVNPLKPQAEAGSGGARSLRELTQSVDNSKDFRDYVLSFAAKAGSRPADIKYEKHPALSPKQQHQTPQPPPQSFSASQPQLGTPERTNTGFDPYQHPSHSGQISGVMPYQPTGAGPDRPSSGRLGSMSGGMQSPGAAPGGSPLPQLPQIGRLSSDYNGQQDASSLPKSSADPWSPAQTQNSFDSRTTGQPTGRYATPPPGGPNQNRPLGGPPGPGPMGSGPNQPARPAGGPGGPNMGFHPGARGPSMDTSSHPNSRGPSLGQQGDFRAPSPGPGYGPPNQPPPAEYRSMQSSAPRPPGQLGPSQGLSNGATAASILPSGQRRADMQRPNLPPLRPVFGVSLDELFHRDASAVPTIVYQCVQAVDIFGLDTEGIYRTSGSAPHIMELKAQFDHDSSRVDLRNPAAFHNDIASVTTLLKHFLRDLPDPLLTRAAYTDFIENAKIDEENARRDALHALINALPDPNYATLRVLSLHMHRVAQRSERNRMTPANLAICLGPTLMGQQQPPAGSGPNGGPPMDVKDAGWQARVVETILNHTLQIFDDDE